MIVFRDYRSSPERADGLDNETVDVWQGAATTEPDVLQALEANLPLSERSAANRLQRFSDRNRYVNAHVMIRSLLGGYIGCAPGALRFKTNAYGKPSILEPEEGRYFRFNLAHSGTMILAAVSRKRDVGIDVELMRDIPDAGRIADRNFSETERAYLRSLPADEFKAGFFACWTLKESFIKAIGKGLSYPLDGFSVSTDDPGKPHLVRTEEPLGDARRWISCSLEVGAHYAAAVTIEEGIEQIRLFRFAPN